MGSNSKAIELPSPFPVVSFTTDLVHLELRCGFRILPNVILLTVTEFDVR